MKVRLELDGTPRDVDVTLVGDRATVRVNGATLDLGVSRVDGGLLLRHGHRVLDVVRSHSKDPAPGHHGHEIQVAAGARRVLVTVVAAEEARRAAGLGGTQKVLKAPMPGRVVRVLVKVGDAVTAGQPLVVLEAMKMENELRAAAAGTVREVHVREGDSIESRATLLTFEA